MSTPSPNVAVDAGRQAMAALLTSQPENFASTPATVVGTVPPFLCGKLLRNGPSQWVRPVLPSPTFAPSSFAPPPTSRAHPLQEVGDSKLLHWFDGFAAIHAFEMDGQGGVLFRRARRWK
jgi:carotenoid cleavage dioxygenase-like enzyme